MSVLIRFCWQVYFRDATWPMLLMTFLAFAGYNFHPILLRWIIWIAHKLGPENIREPLIFLLENPRRCYSLLSPCNVTWVLFAILFALNLVDVLLIILLDLDNEEVKSLPTGSRILAATFQAASARHTGTSTFNLADVNPAVQFSLLTMMYIAVFPSAMCVRSSNTYEERTLGIYQQQEEPDDTQGPLAYINRHARNQLGFDLWYIFLGAFFICIAESGKIMDKSNPAFSKFRHSFRVHERLRKRRSESGSQGYKHEPFWIFFPLQQARHLCDDVERKAPRATVRSRLCRRAPQRLYCSAWFK